MNFHFYCLLPLQKMSFFHYIAFHAVAVTLARDMLASTPMPTSNNPVNDDPPFLGLLVRLTAIDVRKIEAAAGFNAMELMRAAGVPIKAECGGSGVCATCHCRVPAEWADRLPAAANDEVEKLDEIPSADDRSRLSCQIQMTDDLDGLVLEVQPDSLEKRYLDAAE